MMQFNWCYCPLIFSLLLLRPIHPSLVLPSDRNTFKPHCLLNLCQYENKPPNFTEQTTLVPIFNGQVSTIKIAHDGFSRGNNTVVGLALFTGFLQGFHRLVGSLRGTGFDGHIILGVHENISNAEFNYLVRMNVTMYVVTVAQCDSRIRNGKVKGTIRGKCAKGQEMLKLEWARFQFAGEWLAACVKCTGWNLLIDTRDTFFQADPFSSLPSTTKATSVNLMFFEEISPYTSPSDDPARSFVAGNPRSSSHTVPCYGRASFDIYAKRPVLCSGTVLGTAEGIKRFLGVLVDEFRRNAPHKNLNCRSPSTTDQWTMNWLYYNGRFGDVNRTETIPWGTGPVQTVGKACMTKDRKQGATDLVRRDALGRIVNHIDGRLPAVVHQFDRCGDWMSRHIAEHVLKRSRGTEV